jgi:hypothetical protein
MLPVPHVSQHRQCDHEAPCRILANLYNGQVNIWNYQEGVRAPCERSVIAVTAGATHAPPVAARAAPR